MKDFSITLNDNTEHDGESSVLARDIKPEHQAITSETDDDCATLELGSLTTQDHTNRSQKDIESENEGKPQLLELLAPQTIKVLIIEDDFEDFYLVKKLLDHDNFHRYAISNIQGVSDVQETLSTQEFHIILLDLHLNDSEGVESVGAVKRLVRQAGLNIPIIAMTGINDACTGLEAISFGAEDYMPKAEANTAMLSRMIQFSIHRNQLR